MSVQIIPPVDPQREASNRFFEGAQQSLGQMLQYSLQRKKAERSARALSDSYKRPEWYEVLQGIEPQNQVQALQQLQMSEQIQQEAQRQMGGQQTNWEDQEYEDMFPEAAQFTPSQTMRGMQQQAGMAGQPAEGQQMQQQGQEKPFRHALLAVKPTQGLQNDWDQVRRGQYITKPEKYQERINQLQDRQRDRLQPYLTQTADNARSATATIPMFEEFARLAGEDPTVSGVNGTIRKLADRYGLKFATTPGMSTFNSYLKNTVGTEFRKVFGARPAASELFFLLDAFPQIGTTPEGMILQAKFYRDLGLLAKMESDLVDHFTEKNQGMPPANIRQLVDEQMDVAFRETGKRWKARYDEAVHKGKSKK